MTQLNIFEEVIVESSKKINGLQESIKNLKKQYKEVFEKYEDGRSTDLATKMADILVEIKDKKENIKQLKKDIQVNIEELANPAKQ